MLLLSILLRKKLSLMNEELIGCVRKGLFKGYFYSYDKDTCTYNFRKVDGLNIIPVELGISEIQAKFKYKILMKEGL